MPDLYQKPAVDQDGNIVLHGRSGLSLKIAFEDAAGAPRDVTAAAMAFEVAGRLRVMLGAGSAANEKLLELSQAQIGSLCGVAQVPFAFRDESGAAPDVFWTGCIRVEGFKDQPA